MTDPTTKTVRGWQVDILSALAGLGSLGQLASELSYLNRRLWGVDAQGVAIAPADGPPLVDAFIRSLNTPGGAAARTGMLEYIFWRLGEADTTSPVNHLSAIAGATGETSANTYSQGARASLADIAQLTRADVEQIRAVLGNLQTGSSATDLLAALLAAIGAINTAPGGFTARNLLGRILVEQTRAADCCEESSAGSELNPAPEVPGICDWSATVYRVSSWTLARDVDNGGGDLQSIWTAAIPWDSEPMIVESGVSNDVRYYRLTGSIGSTLDVCITWDFTGQQAPRSIGFDTGNSLPDTTDVSYAAPPDQNISGGFGFTTPEIGDGTSQIRYISLTCQFERGITPARNAFVKIRYTPPT